MENNNNIQCVYLLQRRPTQYRAFAFISACTKHMKLSFKTFIHDLKFFLNI